LDIKLYIAIFPKLATLKSEISALVP